MDAEEALELLHLFMRIPGIEGINYFKQSLPAGLKRAQEIACDTPQAIKTRWGEAPEPTIMRAGGFAPGGAEQGKDNRGSVRGGSHHAELSPADRTLRIGSRRGRNA